MDETKTKRVHHRGTGAAGTVTARYERTGPYLGDLAGEWADVQFDDGLFCAVPAAELVPDGERPEPPAPNDYDRGYADGYRNGREDQREGFDALGDDEDDEDDEVQVLEGAGFGGQDMTFEAAPRATRPVGSCPCACNSGGFCGGCGHAGCGGRR